MCVKQMRTLLMLSVFHGRIPLLHTAGSGIRLRSGCQDRLCHFNMSFSFRNTRIRDISTSKCNKKRIQSNYKFRISILLNIYLFGFKLVNSSAHVFIQKTTVNHTLYCVCLPTDCYIRKSLALSNVRRSKYNCSKCSPN